MSQITDIIKQARSGDISTEKLADLLQDYYDKESSRRSFGLVYESHLPEIFEIPHHAICKGDTVSIRSQRGTHAPTNTDTWTVEKTYRDGEELKVDITHTENHNDTQHGVLADRLIKIVSQEDVIYPGLEYDGEVIGDEDNDTFHSVICSENYDTLRMLNSTDLIGKVDCIYIDPPYNTGNKDWIYNNDYIDGSDEFRSSAFMNFLSRRLEEAKTLLNPKNSVMIVTIDEKEYLNVGMLLRQVFGSEKVQMVTSVINPGGVMREKEFARVEEYIYIVSFGDARPIKLTTDMLFGTEEDTTQPSRKVDWVSLRRTGKNWERRYSPGCFYPIYIDEETHTIHSVGQPLENGVDHAQDIPGCRTLLPYNAKGEQSRWQLSRDSLLELLQGGFVKTKYTPTKDAYSVTYLSSGQRQQINDGSITITGKDHDGSLIVEYAQSKIVFPRSVWNMSSHNATTQGTKLINAFHGEARFDFPKSLYAVEDVLRFFVKNKPDATIIDFFGGSGTTAHAVMRLNEQDGGHRKSITITNNEVSLQNNKKFSKDGLQSGDPEWESHGVYEYATKPRLTAAIMGKTASSGYIEDVQGYYKYNDFQDTYTVGNSIPNDKSKKFKDGLKQNIRFFKLKYLNYRDIFLDNADEQLYPLVWLEQGQHGDIPGRIKKYEIFDNYMIVKKLSKFDDALEELENSGSSITTMYVHCDEHTAAQLQDKVDDHVEIIPLWDLYVQRMKTKTQK